METDIERLSREHVAKKTPLPSSVPPLDSRNYSSRKSDDFEDSKKLKEFKETSLQVKDHDLESLYLDDPTNKLWRPRHTIDTDYYEKLFINALTSVPLSLPLSLSPPASISTSLPAPIPALSIAKNEKAQYLTDTERLFTSMLAPVPIKLSVPDVSMSKNVDSEKIAYNESKKRTMYQVFDITKCRSKTSKISNAAKASNEQKTTAVSTNTINEINNNASRIIDTTKLIVTKNLYQCKICPEFYLCGDCKSKTTHPARHEFHDAKKCKSTVNCDRCSIWNTNLDIREKMFQCTTALRYSGPRGTKPSPIQWCLWSQTPEMRFLTYKLFRSLSTVFESRITFNEDAFFKDVSPETRNDLAKLLIHLANAIT